MQIKWTTSARIDLDSEISYLAEDDKDLAIKAYTSIRKQVDALTLFPQKGRVGRIFGTRELVIQGYLYIVPYRVKENVIEILSVFHTKRQLPQAW